MRTRNQLEKQHGERPGTLSDKSREAVGRLLDRTNSRRPAGKKKLDSPVSWPADVDMSEGSSGQDKQNTETGPYGTHTRGTYYPEEKGEKEIILSALPEKKEDMSELEWEDGFIPIPDSRGQHDNVVVEFYDSPSTSNKKPIRRANAEDKESAELIHKVHLLCLVARGRLVDSCCSDPLIQGALLSLLPSYLLKITDVPNLAANTLAPLVKWFHDNFRVECSDLQERSFKFRLASALENRKGTAEEVTALSVALFRALNLTARFVSILDVASLKPITDLAGSSSQGATWMDSGIFDSSTLMVTKSRQVSLSPVQPPSQRVGFKEKSSKVMNDTMLNALASEVNNDSSDACQSKAERSKRKGDLEYELQLDMAVFATATENQTKSQLSSNSLDLPSSSSYLPSTQNKLKKIKTDEGPARSQVISTAIGSRKVGPPLYWAEVFCGEENLTGKWVHVDVVNLLIGREESVEAAISACKRTLRYVVAFAGNGAKDVTRRYCTKWYTIASKRINSQWWDAVLAPLKELESRAAGGVVVPMDAQLEDMELQTKALTEPLPTNQQAYRNHHLYVIERWLTKYEMLRPKGPVLGYCSGHPVYPRTCVQTLQTKQRWLREGLQIKANESPAKVLKHSPKRSKAQTSESGDSKEGDGEGTFALYGKWQTEPLDLPHAVNGIVPKNERGQVDVWSEKCLPRGTVHLRLPRVVPVAKRLGVNFAPAMVGFEFRNGHSVPVFEGIVVCSEFKDAILEAYAEEEEKRTAEEKKRNHGQAMSRWYQLLSSIITRQRLKDTYGDDSTISEPSHRVSQSDSAKTAALKNTDVNEDHEHVFPVEDQSFDEESSVRTKRCPCGFVVQVEEL